jgi:uncharacterized damage-inducible protein DinB
MGTLGTFSAKSLLFAPWERSRATLLGVVEGVSDADARASLAPGLAPIVWNLGHAAVSEDRFLRRFFGKSILPPIWERLFARGTTPLDDPAGYPPIDEVRHALSLLRKRTLRSIATLPDAALSMPPSEPTPAYTSLGEAMTVLALHESYHAGKIAAARRVLGKPGMFEG